MDGWRVPCLEDSKEVDKFLVGDSFVFGTGVADANTFSCASKKLGKNLYTIGIPGVDPSMLLNTIKRNKDLIEIRWGNLRETLPKIVLAIYTGNDYEALLEPMNFRHTSALSNSTSSEARPDKKIMPSIVSMLKSLAITINYEIVVNNRLGLGDSYFINGIKLLANKNRKDGKNFYQFYGGSTFYTEDAPSDKIAVTSSLASIRNTLELNGLILDGLLLIPDPAEISENRFKRNSILRGISSKAGQINTSHKFENIITACKELSINCIDTRDILSEDDYFVHDIHLNKHGVEKIVKHSLYR